MSHVRPGALIAIIVFAVFAAYAFLAPATFRSSALLLVEPANSANPVAMPQPLEAARRLAEAVLDRQTLERLSRERANGGGSEAQAQASREVRRGLEVDTSDGHAFSISYRDGDATRTQRACNELARHAVELAPQVLVDHSAERALDLNRQQHTQELAAFLALHPQVAAEAPPSGAMSPDKDPALSAFHAEKANLEHRIAELESGVASDNPYVDPRESNLKLLRRRLAEIDSALNARRQAIDAKPTGQTLSPELRTEWRRLLDVVSQSSAQLNERQPGSTLLARLATTASLPGSPIEPNRHLLLFFGAVFGLGLGAVFTLTSRSLQIRRTNKSSRPPKMTSLSTTAPLIVQVPSPPAVPSGLGPPVPLTQPQSHRAPPIVPIPQRSVSSSPPGAAPATNGAAASSSRPPPQNPPPPEADVAQKAADRSSRRPASRFASTLVLPPAENPVAEDNQTPDRALASAARDWDQQIRAHEVPGFAVVKPGSEPPPPSPPMAPPAAPVPSAVSSSRPPPPATIQRTTSRPPNQMKVTQPLGSFLPDAEWLDPSKASARRLPSNSSAPRSPSPIPDSQYSYVSSAPPPSIPVSRTPPERRTNVIRTQEVPSTWRPDPTLNPAAQRGLCEQLYPFAVENCFVLAVVGVPESSNYKSRVAAELALALAESQHPRILLVEGDLHRPSVQRVVGVDMPMSMGFSQQLSARARGNNDSRWTVMSCSKSLHVLAEGVMRSPGLLLSTQFSDSVKELRTYYDFIVIDGPTASLEVDAGALNAVADGLVTVCPAKGSPALANMQRLFGKKRFSAFATAL